MGRLPPRRLRRLPRGRAGRGRADRALGARPGGASGVASGGRLRRAVRRGQRLRAPRRRRVHEHAVGLRPAPRPLRVLPRPAVAHRPRRLARLGPAPTAPSRPRSAPSPRSCCPLSSPSVSSRTRRASTPCRARSGCGSRRSSPGPGRPLAGSRSRSSWSASSRRRSSCREGSPGSPCRVAVVGLFAATSYFAWERLIDAPEDLVFAGGLERAWIDERARGRRTGDEALHRHELRLRARAARALPDRVLQRDASTAPRTSATRFPTACPSSASTSAASGALELSPGRPLVADYVFTQPGIELDGQTRRRGTPPGSCSGEVGGPVRVVGASSNAELATSTALRRSAHAAQVAARVERDQELLALAVDLELVRAGEERLDRLERPGQQVLADLPDVRVLDDQVAADGDERRVLGELGLDVRLRVVRVEDDERRLPFGAGRAPRRRPPGRSRSGRRDT